LSRVDLETKVLKQLVRDIIQPERNLGHSDRKHEVKPKLEDKMQNDESVQGTEEVKPIAEALTDFREVAQQACEDCK
jgi:hypothetical protein